MHQGSGITRPDSPKGDVLRNSGSFQTRRNQQRPYSAKLGDRNAVRNIFGGKIRSSSARSKNEEMVDSMPEDMEDMGPTNHKQGCAWQKARSRSRYGFGVSESNSGIMHPKPWGARNPRDIPCFCRVSREPKESPVSRAFRRPSSGCSPCNSQKISDIVENFGIFLERRKFRLTESETPFLMKKLEEKLQTFLEKSSSKTSQPKQDVIMKEPAKKQKNAHSLTPVQRQPMAQPSLSRDQMNGMNQQGQPNIVGKLESKKYFLELTSEEQVPNELRSLLGTMNPAILHHPTEKMLIAMDDKQPTYLTPLPDDYKRYTVKTIDMDSYTGLQLHHQAENTTLLLASTPPPPRRAVPQQNPPVLSHKNHLSQLGYKQGRRN